MTGLLASVVDLAEARLAAKAGVDIIDLKNPAAGALGALPVEDVAYIVETLGGERPISATIGDLPMIPRFVVPAAEAMAATRVDYVKIGFFPGGDWTGVLRGLKSSVRHDAALVAVLFGDAAPDLRWLPDLAEAGFRGVMLDTADKTKGPLCAVCEPGFLREFVAQACRLGLLCGLAGSLRAEHVSSLLTLRADYLGFRSALCRGNRKGKIEPDAVRRLVKLVKGEK
jgi:uncharacterized protein (UPF0264 family)